MDSTTVIAEGPSFRSPASHTLGRSDDAFAAILLTVGHERRVLMVLSASRRAVAVRTRRHTDGGRF